MPDAAVSTSGGGFVEPKPGIIVPNPGGDGDPLGESVLDLRQPWLRIFQPSDVRVVIGRHQDPERECLVDACRTAGVPIHRRVAGGGTVVLAPGMVVIAARLKHTQVGTTCYFGMMNDSLIPGVASVADQAPQCRGYGDLTVESADGVRRKVLGASLRQTSRMVVYLGVFLVAEAAPLMERLLAMPSREPDYRGGRSHGDFCTGLARHGVTVDTLIPALRTSCEQRLAEQALPAQPTSELP
jgi:lipoate-protein ligase A